MELGDVQETLMMPLWGRAHETMKAEPLLRDEAAVAIVNKIEYDFSRIAEKINPLSRASWIARSIYFDAVIRDFLKYHEEAVVLNIGCGLDTTFDRVDNGKASWYELDFPDVIELRMRFIPESKRRIFIARSALDQDWYARIKPGASILILLAGVIYYFTEVEAKGLFREFERRFGKSEVIFDYCSIRGARLANKSVIRKGGMKEGAMLKWGIDDLSEMESWGCGIKVIEDLPMFRQHRKRYPVGKRLGMALSDRMGIMSLARISIG